MSYDDFLSSRTHTENLFGFKPLTLPDFLFDYQKYLVDWAVRKGRAAIFADCGLGKTPMQLAWADNVVRKTGRPVLILTPIAVGAQTVDEGGKFGIPCARSRDGRIPPRCRIVVTNYERLTHFDRTQFAGVVCDESSILKNFDGATKAAVTEFVREIPYRLLCTATAAPNDYVELGTSSEALGELGFHDMVTRFFRKENQKDHRGWGQVKYRMRGYAEKDFWRWVCSWARAVRKPSDLGYDDGRFKLPELSIHEHVVRSLSAKAGTLVDMPLVSLVEQKEEQRRTVPERCAAVAALVADTRRPAVCWCYLNPEGDTLTREIPGAVQVSGKDSDERKEELFRAFAAGQIRVMVTKPTVAGFGLNWQHCDHATFFPSHSFEQYYQAVRRCWRFGQTRPVTVDLVTTVGAGRQKANLQRKAALADAMFDRIVSLMADAAGVSKAVYGTVKPELPTWLSSNKS